VFGLYFVLLGVGALRIASDPVVFATFAVMLSILLIAICWLKGEPSRWRWGKD
jgi:hypothetical protein